MTGAGFRDLINPYLGMIKAAAIVAAVIGLVWTGMKIERAGWIEKQKVAVEQALDGERALQAQINEATSAYIVRLQNQRKAANALPKITLANDCPVPASIGGVLNTAQRMHANAGDESGIGAAGATADSTCAAELDIAKRNYAEVCVPNAQQLNELQKQWELIRSKINK